VTTTDTMVGVRDCECTDSQLGRHSRGGRRWRLECGGYELLAETVTATGAAAETVTPTGAANVHAAIRNGERWPVKCRCCDELIAGIVVWAFPSFGYCGCPWCEQCFHAEDAEFGQHVADELSGMFSGKFAPEPRGLPPMHSCDWCGGQVATPWAPPAATPPWAGPRLAFCSNGCRYARHLAKRRVRHEPRNCVVCGSEFTPARSDAKTCKPACRQKAYRERTALAQSESHNEVAS
jgi:hypothetical protein